MIRRSENRIAALALRDAADWAGEHGVDESDPFATGPAGGAGKFVGSDGTPWIDEFVAPEYGALRGTSTWEASELIHDALDLRHRFPKLWAAVQALRVEVRHARRISQACRDLSQAAAGLVDAELAVKAGCGLPWPRLSKILTAAIWNADPALAQAKLDRARFDRKVWLSESEDGLRTLVIRADQGDLILLYALIERIADILQLDGDPDPVDQRRAKATGWLARPEDLVVLLYRHRHDGRPDRTTGPAGEATGSDDSTDTNNGNAEPVSNPADLDSARSNGEPGSETDSDRSDSNHHPDTAQHKASSPDSSDGQSETADPDTPSGGPEDPVPQPPPDFPEPDWDREPPPEEPGVSDQLPQPRSRWYGTEHLPGPEPCAPVWHGEPPDDDPYPAHPLRPARHPYAHHQLRRIRRHRRAGCGSTCPAGRLPHHHRPEICPAAGGDARPPHRPDTVHRPGRGPLRRQRTPAVDPAGRAVGPALLHDQPPPRPRPRQPGRGRRLRDPAESPRRREDPASGVGVPVLQPDREAPAAGPHRAAQPHR